MVEDKDVPNIGLLVCERFLPAPPGYWLLDAEELPEDAAAFAEVSRKADSSQTPIRQQQRQHLP